MRIGLVLASDEFFHLIAHDIVVVLIRSGKDRVAIVNAVLIIAPSGTGYRQVYKPLRLDDLIEVSYPATLRCVQCRDAVSQKQDLLSGERRFLLHDHLQIRRHGTDRFGKVLHIRICCFDRIRIYTDLFRQGSKLLCIGVSLLMKEAVIFPKVAALHIEVMCLYVGHGHIVGAVLREHDLDIVILIPGIFQLFGWDFKRDPLWFSICRSNRPKVYQL